MWNALLLLLLVVPLQADKQTDKQTEKSANRPDNKHAVVAITYEQVVKWAEEISKLLNQHEAHVLPRDALLKSFNEGTKTSRNGAGIVARAAKAFGDLAESRMRAAQRIAHTVEELADLKLKAPPSYTFYPTVNLNDVKKKLVPFEPPWEKPFSCRNPNKTRLEHQDHFDADVSLKTSSAHVPAEVFDCDSAMVDALYTTESLMPVFHSNYAKDTSISWQYFCSAKGFLRHFPASDWGKMVSTGWSESNDVFDCRLRPWYVAAGGAPRDIAVLIDGTGSMAGSSNLVTAIQYTNVLLTALTDDDRVNVLRFNAYVNSTVSSFDNKLVPANHINTAAMMSNLSDTSSTGYKEFNYTVLPEALSDAVDLLRSAAAPTTCQQAIVLLADSVYENYTKDMMKIDPSGTIRVFVVELRDQNGLRDNTEDYARHMSCERDGYYARMETPNDVTKQVMELLRVLDRPLVWQREQRLQVWSDVYARIEDPRMAELRWTSKENDEQKYRYIELRRNKKALISPERRLKDLTHLERLRTLGHYYEKDEVPYHLQISVSVPVFDATLLENVTVTLMEELQRNCTREYPVARLLGVAGVDIPIREIKLRMPYHELGPGGSLFMLDHRGNVVFHDNHRHVVDGDVLKPGYRTVDFLDIELPNDDSGPRNYSSDVIEFRNNIVITHENGSGLMDTKQPSWDGMRVVYEQRLYHWLRVLDHYTVVVSLPLNATHRVLPPKSKLDVADATALYNTLSATDFTLHPDWLYCRKVDLNITDTPESQLFYFLKRIMSGSPFPMRRSVLDLGSFVPPYKCDEQLLVRLAWEATVTSWWTHEPTESSETTDNHECTPCHLGSTTAFIATEGGLTRWQRFYAPSAKMHPPPKPLYRRGPSEQYYRRAAASPDILVVYAPILPNRVKRRTEDIPPEPEPHQRWLTAARALDHVGVTGFHFHPAHLVDLLDIVTALPCLTEPCLRCDNENWRCMLVDEEGWIIAEGLGGGEAWGGTHGHLAREHPGAMRALLAAGVYSMRQLYDYQAVCFPPSKKSVVSSSIRLVSSVVQFVASLIRDAFSWVMLFGLLEWSKAETVKDVQMRHNRTVRESARERFDRLYDRIVLVNRTTVTACDRARTAYQRTGSAGRLRRQPSCPDWPLAAAPVPGTNLLLLAVNMVCATPDTPLPHPMDNLMVNMSLALAADGLNQSHIDQAGLLAWWRNRVPLPTRKPSAPCYPHEYQQEKGWRQCGPLIPDKDQE